MIRIRSIRYLYVMQPAANNLFLSPDITYDLKAIIGIALPNG